MKNKKNVGSKRIYIVVVVLTILPMLTKVYLQKLKKKNYTLKKHIVSFSNNVFKLHTKIINHTIHNPS